MLNTIANAPNTSLFIQRDIKASVQEKEIETQKQDNKEMIKALFENSIGKLTKEFLTSNNFSVVNEFGASIGLFNLLPLEKIESLMQTANVREGIIWNISQKFVNVSVEKYQSAKAYIYNQMEEIALSVYEEEGKSDLLATLFMISGHSRYGIDLADKVANGDLESSAREFALSIQTKNKEKIVQAQEELSGNLSILGSASMMHIYGIIEFFTFTNHKIPQENLQKIIDSLGIMKSYIDNNYDITKGPIKTKNGMTIDRQINNGITTILITQPFDKVANLIFEYEEKNHQTILQMLEQKDKLSQNTFISSSDSLMQTLLKESKEERKEE